MMKPMRVAITAILLMGCVSNAQEQAALSPHDVVPKDVVAQQPGLMWVRRSAEYAIITARLYEEAKTDLDAITRQRGADQRPWVVVLDADETILDNSQYQVEALQAGAKDFDPVAWRTWVKREEATAVPGALSFLDHIRKRGGKLVIITNRDQDVTSHSRANLSALGFDADRADLCILGREQQDRKDANPQEWEAFGYGNDKDRRRRLIIEGKAEACWNWQAGDALEHYQASWAKPHEILMYVGDNIKDFPALTETIADDPQAMQAVMANPQYVLLPNPVYGSWESRLIPAAALKP
ncbi:HAD family acid phosphatase [Iodidimonas sp. MBR-55]|jgi:5'-nucleotidase (lipoprotein e(P4) family)|uniref:HAD family acid phosphatase n=2 Tax=Iodidimonas TaxID=2066486 RepID=UPI002482885C|nr:HAD family acid phosphatase [Iodidimonas sp. MBR-55]